MRFLYQIKGMKRVKSNPLNKTKEERETCFPEAAREEIKP